MRTDDRETGPRTDQQVDVVAGVMAQVDGATTELVQKTHGLRLSSAGMPAHRTGVAVLNRHVPV